MSISRRARSAGWLFPCLFLVVSILGLPCLLRAAEDIKAGVYYAQEIFAAKQEKLALETEMEITRRQRVRLLMR